MKIVIKSGEELNELLDAAAKDIVDANIYYKLFTGLTNSFSEYSVEENQSHTFWWLTHEAIKDAYMIRLCRVFDQNTNSLNLVNLLDTIKSNRHFFDEPHFRERLKGNAFVDSLAEGVVVPSLEELQADIEYASDRNPVVFKLMLWRNNVYAHTGKPNAAGVLKDNSISEEEIEQLLNKCFSISNKYMSLYKSQTWSSQIVGQDDYLSLFKFIRMGLEKHTADLQRGIGSWSSEHQ